MSRLNLLRLFRGSIVFIFVFSIFNDNLLVDIFGENVLKGIFLLFIVVNLRRLYLNILNWRMLRNIVPFFIFLILTYFIMLINFAGFERLLENSFLWISMLVIVVYFINYDINEVVYMIWASLIISSIYAFFSQPISEWTFRKTGGTGDPNEFAAQLLSVLPLSVYLFTVIKSMVYKTIVICVSLAVFIYALFIAGSMSGFLMLGFLIPVVLIRFMSLSFTKSLMVIGLGLLMFMISLLVFQEKLENTEAVQNMLGRTQETGTAQTRLNSWKAGINMFIEQPFLGVGMRQYAEYSPKYSKTFLSSDSVAPHNMFIEVLAESGIIVFIAFVIFLIDLMSRYFNEIRRSSYFWLYLSLLAYILMGFTLGITYNKFMWLSVAILMNVHRIFRTSPENEAEEDRSFTRKIIDLKEESTFTYRDREEKPLQEKLLEEKPFREKLLKGNARNR
ncbi:MAG: O-antigen ligase family protein [Ignavibacteria bacterium]|jgi:O-antigen ligase|nr:O-antigen ligase family protein [Ignavibacteria bacterium]MCU7504421.1 O-antigen ligase family protein [Ignavibacteria bacterium]MCU7517488.1 O-antigen ligase family protein [Ignavibacteria bacterium]